ncbi:MAG TPA: mechanosensitive ion channel domain-containing protein, partial [Burkholderiales bacterium]
MMRNMRGLAALAAQAVLGLFPPGAAGQMPKLPGIAAEAPKAPTPAQTATASPEEIRKKLAAAESELAKLQAPGGLSAGTPPGTAEQDLVRRRFLVQQMVRAYRRQLTELAAGPNLEKRRAEVQDRVRDWKGFEEKPPYSIVLVDRLRQELQDATLRLNSADALVRMIDSEAEAIRGLLQKSQELLRKAEEQLESARGDPARAAAAAWRRDLEALAVRTGGATLAALEIARDNARADIAIIRLESEFTESQLKEAEKQVHFSQADMDAIKSRVAAQRTELQKELDAALVVRSAAERKLTETGVRVTAERQKRDALQRELEEARKAAAGAAADVKAGEEKERGLLDKLNPVAALEARRARDQAAQLQARVGTLEKDAAGGAAALTALERSEEVQRVRDRTAAITVELITNLIMSSDIQSAFWDLRFSAASGGDRSALDLAKVYEGSQALLKRLDPTRDYIRHQLELTLTQVAQQQGAVVSADDPASAEHARAMVEALADRERAYIRALSEIQQLRQLLERWVAEFRTQAQERRAADTTRYWLDTVRKILGDAWQFELFTVQDTIEVDGQKITGSRGVTVGKVTTAILILVLGYLLLRVAARVAEWVAVARWKADPNQVRLAAKWLTALAMLVLVLISLELVKIPLTVFAFLGGAVAIGAGFGMQNMLKNLISGIMVITERPFRLGDIVEVGGIRGEVTDINVRASTVRDVNGIETLIPNSTFVEQNVTNWTYTTRRVRYSVKVGVAYGCPVKQVAELLQEVAQRHGLILKDPPPEVLFEDFGAVALMFGLYYWLELGPKVASRLVASDLRFMIEKSFAEHGIAIAFPQRDVHLDTGGPLKVQV